MRLLRYLPRFRKAYRALEALASREHWSRAEIEAFQLDRLNILWRHAIAHVPYYRRLAAAPGLPPHFASLPEFQAAVPLLPKEALKRQTAALLSEKAGHGHWERTGGSTGAPLSAYWANDAHQEVLRFKYRFYAMWGLDIFDPVAFLWGASASFKPGPAGHLARFRQPLEDRLRNRLRLSAYRLGRNDLQEYLRQIAAFRPVALYGYSRALALLAREAEATGFRCDSLRTAILTGEPALPHIVSAVERAFGVAAVVEYGSVECGFLAGQWPDQTLRAREDGVLLETLRRDDGRHDLVVTVLTNPSFPLIRYAIGDIADAPLDFPARGFAVLKNVAGRDNDLVLSRSGRYVHSACFDALFKHESKFIRRFRIRQHSDGGLAVALELDEPGAPLDRDVLAHKLRDLVEGYPVKLEVVDAIPQTASGKHRLVVSDLDAATPSPRNGVPAEVAAAAAPARPRRARRPRASAS